MNSIVIHGRLVRDPEIKYFNNDKQVTTFTVAVNRRFKKEEADFFDCQAWGKTAELVDRYFRRGQEIVVQGAMQRRQWEGKDGQKRYTWELIADIVEFCGSKNDNQGQKAAPIEQGEGLPAKEEIEADGFTEVEDTADDDIPF